MDDKATIPTSLMLSTMIRSRVRSCAWGKPVLGLLKSVWALVFDGDIILVMDEAVGVVPASLCGGFIICGVMCTGRGWVSEASARDPSLRRSSKNLSVAVLRTLFYCFATFRFTKPEKVA